MTKLVFISNMAAPYQVKLCYELQKYFDTEFWFYEYVHKGRPKWWRIPLGDRCKILEGVFFSYRRKYITFSIFKELKRFDPDIVMIGGFTIPSNWLAYLWAKKRNKKIILFSEHWRSESGKERDHRILTSFFHWMYKDINALFSAGDHAKEYFIEVFSFSKEIVHSIRYPNDLDKHLKHPLRKPKKAYTYLFSHRLIDIYNPLVALDIFKEISEKYHGSKMMMNGFGDLRKDCEQKIETMNLSEDVKFLDKITSWNDLHKVYLKADILLAPAKYSNGNMSIREAMASGMGVVISNKIKTNTDEIIRYNNGFVCEPTIQSFLDAVENYIEHPELFVQHGLISKEVFQPNSIAGTAEKYRNLILKKVLS